MKLYGTYNIEVIPKIIHSRFRGLLLLVAALFYRILLMLGIRTSSGFKELAFYNNCDVIIDLSGDCLSAPLYSRKMFFKLQRNILAVAGDAYLLLLLTLLKKPIIIYAQTIGPIGILEPLIVPLLQKMSIITVREEKSLKYLGSKGISPKKLFLTADPAFLLSSPSKKEVERILFKEGISFNTPIIGVCVSSETLNYHFKDDNLSPEKFFANVIDYLIEKYNVQVIIFPFSTWSGHGGDDSIASLKVINLIKNKDRVKLIRGDYNPAVLKGIIARCEMFIGMRGHSCILALSSCVPTIAIGHNPKYEGIMKMMGQERYTCNVKELTLEKLFSLVDDSWNNRNKTKMVLKARIKEVQDLAKNNARLVYNLVKELKLL